MSRFKYYYNWLFIAIVALTLVCSITDSIAHSWYSPSCCSGQDCHPVPCEELTELTDGGYKYQDFVFTKQQVHPSQDNQCHVCIHEYTAFDKHKAPMCVYTQQGS